MNYELVGILQATIDSLDAQIQEMQLTEAEESIALDIIDLSTRLLNLEADY